MNKKLIINADDFGYTAGVTYGIIESFKTGIVSSTTALVVSDFFIEAMDVVAKLAPTLPIGLHLTLTLNEGRPVLPKEKIPSLTNDNGSFWKLNVFDVKISIDEVYQEWDAQFEKFLQSGKKPTHLDSHHNVHGKNKELLQAATALAKKHNIPLRNYWRSETQENLSHLYDQIKTTDELLSQFYGNDATIENLQKIINHIEKSNNSSFEVNVHPAFLDPALLKVSSYAMERMKELEILTSPQAKEIIQQSKVELINYQML